MIRLRVPPVVSAAVVAVAAVAAVVAVVSAAFNQGLPLEAGTYNLKLTVGGKDYTTKIVVENDPGD